MYLAGSRAVVEGNSKHSLKLGALGRRYPLAGLLVFMVLAICPANVFAQADAGDTPNYGINLERYEYPHPVNYYEFEVAGRPLRMAYMDFNIRGQSNGVVVLLHGKNFCGAYWEQTARSLNGSGYRVIVPDQIGFGKSTKAVDYQYSFNGLAANTKSLLNELGIEKAVIVGHSMGGMVASRFAIAYPDMTEKLVLVNPIGLEDWADKGVPYRGMDAWYERELSKSAAGIKKYQLESYYDGDWKPAYQQWVDVLVGMTQGDEYPTLARVQAMTYDMIYTQPVVDDFPLTKSPTLLIIGQRDRTALGKDLVSPELKAELGLYPKLGRAAAKSIPDAKLVELDGIGHLPHIEAYDRFWPALQQFISD